MQSSENLLKKKISAEKFSILITIAFLVIVSYVAAFHHDYWVIDHDGQIYLHAGELILEGNGNNVKLHNAPVGGPVIYAFVNSFFNDGFNVMKTIAILSATGSVFFSYKIIKNISNSKTALVGQLLFAFNPWLGFFSIQAENELLPIFLISASLYFITKKELKIQDIIITGILLGISSTIRFQAVILLLSFLIYIIIRNKKIVETIIFILIILLAFSIIISPMIIYNYSTHDSIFDTNAAFFIQMENTFVYPEWQEKLKEINFYNGSTTEAIFVDFELFLKNYFHNLFYNMPNRLFNFGYDNLNSSLITSVPFLGLIPIFASLIYLFKVRINKNNLLILSSTSIITSILVLTLGDINTHFFAIIGIPMFFLCVFNFQNVAKNNLPLLILPALFIPFMSLAFLRVGEHFFILWFSGAFLGGIFFIEVLPKLLQKVQKTKIQLNFCSKNSFLITTLIVLILLSNFGYGYVLYRATHSNDSFVSIENEFSKIFNNKLFEDNGLEVQKIGEILSRQPNIQNSYVMVPHHHYAYYIDAKIVEGTFSEGISNDTLENYVTRKNWTNNEIFNSNLFSQPMDRNNINNPKPDYLIYVASEPEGNTLQHEYLKILSNPEHPSLPSNFEAIYFSDKANFKHVIYKINYQNND